MRSSIRGFDMDSGVGGRGSGVRTSTALVVDRTPDTQPLTPSSRVRPQTMAGLAWWRFPRPPMGGAGVVVGAAFGPAPALPPRGCPHDPGKTHPPVPPASPHPGAT